MTPGSVAMLLAETTGLRIQTTSTATGAANVRIQGLRGRYSLLLSDGLPLYLLSNAVDDIRDGITHVIRGQDGLGNTPRQILLYRALGKPLPVFAHMNLTLDPKRAKISSPIPMR